MSDTDHRSDLTPTRQTWRAAGYLPWLIAATWVLALAAAALSAWSPPHSYSYWDDDVSAPPALRGFWPAESNGALTYRWTRGSSAVRLYGLETASAVLVTLRLTGPQSPGAPPVPLTLGTGAGARPQLEVAPVWRVYQVLVPQDTGSWGTQTLTLTSDARPAGGGDGRLVGVAVSAVGASPAGPRAVVPALERAAYVAALAAGLLLALVGFLPRQSAAAVAAIPLLLVAGCMYAWPATLAWRLPVDRPLAASVVGAGAVVLALRLAAARLPRWLCAVVGIVTGVAGLAIVHAGALTLLSATLAAGGLAALGACVARGAAPEDAGVRGPGRSPSVLAPAGALLVTLAVTPLFTAGLDDMSAYHSDEGYWASYGAQTFRLFFVDHDYDAPLWYDSRLPYVTPHPQVGKYIIGSSLFFAGYEDVPVLMYDWTKTLAGNRNRGLFLGEPIISAARMSVALTAAASCGLLFWLATLTAGPLHGLLAVLGLIGGGLLLQSGRRAMIDAPGLCFGLLALVCLVYLLRALRAGRGIGIWSAATGVACGLAISTKISFVLFPAACVAALAAEAGRRLRARRGSPGLALDSATLTVLWMLLVFYLSNPFLYRQPVEGTLHIVGFLSAVGSTPHNPTPTLAGKLAAVWGSIGQYGPLGRAGLPGDHLLMLVGCGALVALARQAPRAVYGREMLVVACWLAVVHVGLALSLPANTDRYFLVLQPGNAFLQACAVVWLAGLAWRAVRGSSSRLAPLRWRRKL